MDALEIEDENERLFRLYAIFQTSPQLFGAINQHLSKENQLECENEFQNVKEVELPVHNKVLNAGEDMTVKKCLQLSPYLLKDQPPRIKEHSFDCIAQDNLFASDEERGQVYSIFNMAPDSRCEIACPVQNKLLQDTPVISIRPKNSPNNYPRQPYQGYFVYDDERKGNSAFRPSKFAENYKNSVKQKFLSLINEKHKQLHIQELVEILQTVEARNPPSEQLDLAVSFLYFDKLDIIYTF